MMIRVFDGASMRGRRLAWAAFAVGALAVTSARAQAPGIEGLWLTPLYDGRIEIAPCGAALCGRLVDSTVLRSQPAMRNARDRDPSRRALPLRGLTILTGLTRSGGQWNGEVYNPDDGRTYDAHLRLTDARTLNVSGCALLVFCRSQTWRRLR